MKASSARTHPILGLDHRDPVCRGVAFPADVVAQGVGSLPRMLGKAGRKKTKQKRERRPRVGTFSGGLGPFRCIKLAVWSLCGVVL